MATTNNLHLHITGNNNEVRLLYVGAGNVHTSKTLVAKASTPIAPPKLVTQKRPVRSQPVRNYPDDGGAPYRYSNEC